MCLPIASSDLERLGDKVNVVDIMELDTGSEPVIIEVVNSAEQQEGMIHTGSSSFVSVFCWISLGIKINYSIPSLNEQVGSGSG